MKEGFYGRGLDREAKQWQGFRRERWLWQGFRGVGSREMARVQAVSHSCRADEARN